jgi:hypothetical protein
MRTDEVILCLFQNTFCPFGHGTGVPFFSINSCMVIVSEFVGLALVKKFWFFRVINFSR